MAPADAALRAVKTFRVRELTLSSNWVPRPPADVPSGDGPLQLHNPFLPRKNPETGRWAPPKYSRRRQAELIKHARASNTLHLLPAGPKLSLKQLRQAYAAAPSTPTPVQSCSTASTPSTSASVQKTSSPQTEAVEASAAVETPKIEVSAIVEGAGQPWNVRVTWAGKVPEKKEVGARLYARKKRMFKGHKWERVQKARVARRTVLMRDMQKRIARYKTYYRKRTPSQLSTPRNTGNTKLPF